MDGAVGNCSEQAAMAAIATSHAVGTMGQSAAVAAAGAPTAAAAAKLLPAERDVREAKRRLKEAEVLLSKFPRYRANDYAVEESDLRRSLILNSTESQFQWDKAFSWLLSIIIGILNGIAGFLFTQGINWLNRAKFETALQVISPNERGILSYLIFLAFSLLYAAGGALLGSYVSPQAAGSGIPEIRCYLNGIHVKGLLTVRTFLAKCFGVVLSVSSGLIVGKEGPFTHVGAILGGGVAHLGSTTLTRATNGQLRAKLHTRFGRYFKSSVSHRDYVAAGASAGVASAFAAPLGGILFSVEQGASFYNFNMLSHAFLSAGIAVYVSALLQGAMSQGSSLYKTAMTTKQAFVLLSEVPDNTRLWYYSWELPIFAVMGVLGGLLGAGSVVLNNAVTRLRRRFIPPTKPARRVAEVLAIAAVTATAWFLVSYLSPCASYPPKYLLINDLGNSTTLGDPVVLFGGYYPQLWCPDGYYSEFGMLFFMPQMTTITMLFQYQLPNGASFIYSIGGLVCLFGLGWFFMTITFGIGAVTGLFVPSMLVGGAGGRLMGRLVRYIMMQLGYQNDAGTGVINICLSAYAIVGAGSVLGGVSRMLLCNTVLVMETAAASNLIMPLIVTTFIGKAVADLLTPVGLFDLAIERAGYPYLEAELNDLTDIKLQHALTAGDVMSSQIATMPAVLSIGDIVARLRRYPIYSTFPLTEPLPAEPQPASTTTTGAEPAAATCAEAGPGPGTCRPPARDAGRIPVCTPRPAAAAGGGGTPASPRGGATTAVSSRAEAGPGAQRDHGANGGAARAPADPGVGPTHGSPANVLVASTSAAAPGAKTMAASGHTPAGSSMASSSAVSDSGDMAAVAAAAAMAAAAADELRPTGRLDSLSAPVAPPPRPPPTGWWQPFHVPPQLNPLAGVAYLSAFSGGVVAAAAAAAPRAVLPAEVLRRLGWKVSSRGAGAAAGASHPADAAAAATAAGRVKSAANNTAAPAAPAAADAEGGGGGGAATGVIIGTINRSVLLKLLEMHLELNTSGQQQGERRGRRSPPPPASLSAVSVSEGAKGGLADSASGVSPNWLSRRRATMSRQRAERLMDAVDNYPSKAPSDRAGEEKLFAKLGPSDLATFVDLRHYMQRVPYIVPASASLARTYRLFRGLGLHHIFVTAPNIPIIGLITRTNIAPANAYKVAYELAQREQQQLHALLAGQPAAAAARAAAGDGDDNDDGGEDHRGGDGGTGPAAGPPGEPHVQQQQQQMDRDLREDGAAERSSGPVVYRASFDGGVHVFAAEDGTQQPPPPQRPPARWSLDGTPAGGAAAAVGPLHPAAIAQRGSLEGVAMLPLPPELPRSADTSRPLPAVRDSADGRPPNGRPLSAATSAGLDERERSSRGEAAASAAAPEPRADDGDGSDGGGGGALKTFIRRRLRLLRLRVASSDSDSSGQDGDGASSPRRDSAAAGAASPTAAEGGLEGGVGLRRRARRGRGDGGDAPAPPPPTAVGPAGPGVGQPWPMITPFSALVYGGAVAAATGGAFGAVPRRSTAPDGGTPTARSAAKSVTNTTRLGPLRSVRRTRTLSRRASVEAGAADAGDGPDTVGDVEAPAPAPAPALSPRLSGRRLPSTARRRLTAAMSVAVQNFIRTGRQAEDDLTEALGSPWPPQPQPQPPPQQQQQQPHEQLGGGVPSGDEGPPLPQSPRRTMDVLSVYPEATPAEAAALEPAPPVEALLAATFLPPQLPLPPLPSAEESPPGTAAASLQHRSAAEPANGGEGGASGGSDDAGGTGS